MRIIKRAMRRMDRKHLDVLPYTTTSIGFLIGSLAMYALMDNWVSELLMATALGLLAPCVVVVLWYGLQPSAEDDYLALIARDLNLTNKFEVSYEFFRCTMMLQSEKHGLRVASREFQFVFPRGDASPREIAHRISYLLRTGGVS